MKASIYNGTKRLEIKEVENPKKNRDEAIIEMSYAGICGTDMMIYAGGHPRATAPLVMGHEFSGVIKEIKLNNDFHKGDRVVVNPLLSCKECPTCLSGNYHICDNLKYLGIDKNGGFAEFVNVPIENLYKIPNEVSSEIAALVEPLAVAIHTVRRSNLLIGDVVAILGAGPIGILIGLIAKKAGASKIIISDLSDYRLRIATSFGFTTVDSKKTDILEVINEYTNDVGADIVFEVAGNQITANQMIPAIKTQGQVMIVSVYKESPKIDLAKMHFREISLATTRCFTNNDFKKAIEILADNDIDVSKIISHKLPLDDIEEGFKLVEDSSDSLKVLFHI